MRYTYVKLYSDDLLLWWIVNSSVRLQKAFFFWWDPFRSRKTTYIQHRLFFGEWNGTGDGNSTRSGKMLSQNGEYRKLATERERERYSVATLLVLPPIPLFLILTSDAPRILLLKPCTSFSQTVQSILFQGSESQIYSPSQLAKTESLH